MEKIKEALAKAKTATQFVESKPKARNLAHKATLMSDVEDIEYLNTPVINLNPSHLEKNRIITYNQDDPFSIVFDLLRTQVLRIMEENNWHSIAIVSPTPESGKTFTAINLAISIANQPAKTVMLVDFDLRRPRVASYLGLKISKSLNDYIEGSATIEDIIVNPGIPKLVVLPTVKSVKKSAEIIGSDKIRNLIDDISTRYQSRVIIFDLPPMLSSDDAIAMLPMVDCVLVVVGNGLSSQAEIEDTLYHIPKEKLLGIVMNKAEVEPRAYYHY